MMGIFEALAAIRLLSKYVPGLIETLSGLFATGAPTDEQWEQVLTIWRKKSYDDYTRGRRER